MRRIAHWLEQRRIGVPDKSDLPDSPQPPKNPTPSNDEDKRIIEAAHRRAQAEIDLLKLLQKGLDDASSRRDKHD